MVRIKHRYLLLNILYPEQNTSKSSANYPDFLKFHAPTPQHVTAPVFLNHLRKHIGSSFGDQGLGLCLSSLKLLYFSNATSTAILRVPRAHYSIVWATLIYMTDVPAPRGGPPPRGLNLKCVIRVVRVSGTIRKAEEELQRRNRRQIVQAKLAGMDASNAILSRLSGEATSTASSALHQDDMLEDDVVSADDSDSD